MYPMWSLQQAWGLGKLLWNKILCHIINISFLLNYFFRFLEALNHFEKAKTLICRLPGILTWPTSNVIIEESKPEKVKVTLLVQVFHFGLRDYLQEDLGLEDRGSRTLCTPLGASLLPFAYCQFSLRQSVLRSFLFTHEGWWFRWWAQGSNRAGYSESVWIAAPRCQDGSA